MFKELLQASVHKGSLPHSMYQTLLNFYQDYQQAIENNPDSLKKMDHYFTQLLHFIEAQLVHPFVFKPFHQHIRSPFDYYEFGKNFLKLVVEQDKSLIQGHDHLKEATQHLKKGDNVILFSNHQSEADPQAISLLLDESYPGFAENIIFVAGDRVTTDPFAVPFSMGRNLLCIYSKKYIEYPPEKKTEKQFHNKKTMELMSDLLREGGKCIYVAPSGGRDRKNSEGNIEIARFDPQSIEMFYLMAKKSETLTYFYPLSLSTYMIFPPPSGTNIAIGEPRRVQRGTIHLNLGASIDMEKFSPLDFSSKDELRQTRADYIWDLVNEGYKLLLNLEKTI